MFVGVIDGGYGSWGEWASCSGRCSDKTTRRRTCHNPTPCNGGKDCSEFGRSELKKLCGILISNQISTKYFSIFKKYKWKDF